MGGMNWKSYERPKDLNEALALLAQAGGRGRVIAGGRTWCSSCTRRRSRPTSWWT